MTRKQIKAMANIIEYVDLDKLKKIPGVKYRIAAACIEHRGYYTYKNENGEKVFMEQSCAS